MDNIKIRADFTKPAFENKKLVDIFLDEVDTVGIWKSEEILIESFIGKRDIHILDAACGTGRISFNLYKKGYRRLAAYDFSNSMINACINKAEKNQISINFSVADSRNLPYSDEQFGACIYAFNGIMNIPQRGMRAKAFSEISRVLKPGSIFIFDAFCMQNPPFLSYWEEERVRWQKGVQDPRLHEFGDLIFLDSRSNRTMESFCHVPVEGEVEEETAKAGFEILKNAMRSEIAEESALIRENFGEVRFWVCRKK